MTDPGERPHHIVIQRQGTAIDDGYTTLPGAWAAFTTAWARVRYGTGQERREAAQEQATQAATFETDWSSTLETVAMTDRIVFDSENWDITSAVTVGLNRERHFTAVRSA